MPLVVIMQPKATFSDFMSASTSQSSEVSGRQKTTRSSSKARAKSVKLSADLVALAEDEASIAQRSMPKQIEYWSLLGRAVERYLRYDQSRALLTDQKSISEVTMEDVIPSPDVVMRNLEERRASGELAASVTFAEESFEAVDGQDEVFKKIRADGSEVLGTLRNGEFVENQ